MASNNIMQDFERCLKSCVDDLLHSNPKELGNPLGAVSQVCDKPILDLNTSANKLDLHFVRMELIQKRTMKQVSSKQELQELKEALSRKDVLINHQLSALNKWNKKLMDTSK